MLDFHDLQSVFPDLCIRKKKQQAAIHKSKSMPNAVPFLASAPGGSRFLGPGLASARRSARTPKLPGVLLVLLTPYSTTTSKKFTLEPGA